jgi:hypothetical protein
MSMNVLSFYSSPCTSNSSFCLHKQYQMVKEVNNQKKSLKETFWWNNEVLCSKSVECRLFVHPKSVDVFCCNLSTIALVYCLQPRFVHQYEDGRKWSNSTWYPLFPKELSKIFPRTYCLGHI